MKVLSVTVRAESDSDRRLRALLDSGKAEPIVTTSSSGRRQPRGLHRVIKATPVGAGMRYEFADADELPPDVVEIS